MSLRLSHYSFQWFLFLITFPIPWSSKPTIAFALLIPQPGGETESHYLDCVDICRQAEISKDRPAGPLFPPTAILHVNLAPVRPHPEYVPSAYPYVDLSPSAM